jgi:hypothetical protein
MNDKELKYYTDNIVKLLNVKKYSEYSEYSLNLEGLENIIFDGYELDKDEKILIDEFLLSNSDSRTSQEIYLDNLINNFFLEDDKL